MKNDTLFDETNRATYCPEDDKIRLYVGRVPRPEFEALRAEGWTSTPKQDCDFVAVWTPDREDTAISYAGIIEDEDAGPDERAADRAERFGGYLDKRLDEATGHADRFDAGPSAHGYQSKARAVRAADRHDRIGTRAVNAWDKAEYWQQRTAGVISHALHLQSPGVRMGRIKTIEAELRKAEKSWQESTERRQRQFDAVQSVADHAAGNREKLLPAERADFVWELSNIRQAAGTPDNEKSPPEDFRRAVLASALDSWHDSDATNKALAKEAKAGTRPAHEIAAQWLEGRTRPADWNPEEGTRYTRHLRLRLAYENQMLEAQGGRLANAEMVKGGTLGGRVIAKVNKSTATGRVVSVAVVGPNTGERWTYGATNEPGTPFALYTIKTERLAPGSYSEPTPGSLAKLAKFEDAKKAALAAHKEKVPTISLVNPTMADAERLQALFNAANVARWEREHGRKVTADLPSYYTPPKSAEVWTMTQAQYSAASKGSYSKFETREVCAMGILKPPHSNLWSSSHKVEAARRGPVLVKVRVGGYEPYRVIHITDKPAKALPAALWQAFAPAVTPETMKPFARELVAAVALRTDERDTAQEKLVADGVAAGLVNDDCRQSAMTEAGHAWAREAGAYSAAV